MTGVRDIELFFVCFFAIEEPFPHSEVFLYIFTLIVFGRPPIIAYLFLHFCFSFHHYVVIGQVDDYVWTLLFFAAFRT